MPVRDVFYYGAKPNVHPRERFAESINDARQKCTTEHFWIINEFCDYRGFDWDWDFEFLPDEDVWAEKHNNVWPSQHQKDSGTWLCSCEQFDQVLTLYRNDVDPVKRKNIKTDNWIELFKVDSTQFDFSWHPDPTDPPYIYVWGNKWIDGKTHSTLEYHVSNATNIKFMHDNVALASSYSKFDILDNIDEDAFDFSWIPNPKSPPYIYVWGNQWNKPEDRISVQYVVDGATQYKYMEERVTRRPDLTNWQLRKGVDVSNFDFSWEPSPADNPYIYEFGTQWQKTGGPRYVVEGAIDVKYVDIMSAISMPNNKSFVTMRGMNIKSFDYSWHPDSTEQPYIYVFGNQWYSAEVEPTIEYRMPDAIEKKYVTDIVAILEPNFENWITPDNIDASGFDYSWHPEPGSPPYIYEFATQWQKTGGPRYVVEGAIDVKYVDIKVNRLPSQSDWNVLTNLNIEHFDYSWHPDSTEQPYIYVFGNQWYSAEVEPTIEYRVEGATEYKYITNIVATLSPDMSNWIVPANVENFDYSWHPEPGSPPYIYQFGTLVDPNDGPKYVVPNNDGTIVKLERVETRTEHNTAYPKYLVETTLDALVKKHPNEIFWAINPDLDYSEFDFTWKPNIEQAEYVHAFGSSDSVITQTYLINGPQWNKGNRELNWVQDTQLSDKSLYKLFKKSDMFFVDRGNLEAQSRFEALKCLYPQIQKTRYLNTWVDTINRCANRSTTDLFWVLNSEFDYSGFDFEYYPNPWQMKMVHVFGTQWSHWGTTFMVNRETFSEDTKYIKIIEHISNINFVKHIRTKATQCVYDTIIMDHGNKELEKVLTQVTKKTSGKNVTVVKYNVSYLQTLKDIVSTLTDKKEHFLWLCSSVCDYSTFDFSYVCDPFAKDNLHVFPSGTQKFGDTFLIDVNKTKEIINDMTGLEDYHKVNYNNTQRVSRLPEPVIVTNNDTLIEAATRIEGFPYATIISSDNKNINTIDNEPMNLWAPETKTILVTSTGATRISVPREVKNHVKKELYDYPYIKKASKLSISSPMDIVYLSNGETGAEENWEHLQKITHGLKNRVVRVDGVNGRVQAYHAAAEASETPWMFTVFAKLKISPKFDFNYQPDRMQVAKHYVFHAKNPVNGLIYGHQAMILYNKKLTLANNGKGLDFTLDDEHEVVPLLSGVANYNTDEFSTWRTAFREVLKLKAEDSEISRTRLDAWLIKAEGNFSQYSIKGAIDAVEYYDEVDGDFDMLKLSYEWAWLREKFFNS